MLGLKTQESNKFIEFMKIVQDEARKHNSIFFLDSGDGRDFETDHVEGEDLQGWLIPENKADAFKAIWEAGNADDDWVGFFCFATWENSNGNITVQFDFD